MDRLSDVLDLVPSLKARGEAFALATVVRTVAATAAKAGAKAIIRADGSISEGWIGGGCARGAVLKAAREALADGRARLISVQPPDVLQEHGVAAGEEREGVRFARNTCPSHGTMDIFIEPMLPRPQIVLCGSSPVAVALADLAPRLGFSVTACAPPPSRARSRRVDRRIDGYALPAAEEGERFIVVSTQGRGDEAALIAALSTDARYVAFVGSRLKAQTLKAALAARGVDGERLAALRAPAGLDLGAIGPEEIALSIMAEIVAFRRGRELGSSPMTLAPLSRRRRLPVATASAEPAPAVRRCGGAALGLLLDRWFGLLPALTARCGGSETLWGTLAWHWACMPATCLMMMFSPRRRRSASTAMAVGSADPATHGVTVERTRSPRSAATLRCWPRWRAAFPSALTLPRSPACRGRAVWRSRRWRSLWLAEWRRHPFAKR